MRYFSLVFFQPVPSKTITEGGIKSLAAVKVFPKLGARINHLHYSDDGKLLIASSDDESINLYDCVSGSFSRMVATFCFWPLHRVSIQINSKKYGANLVHFVRGSNDVITASTKIDSKQPILRLYADVYVLQTQYDTSHLVTINIYATLWATQSREREEGDDAQMLAHLKGRHAANVADRRAVFVGFGRQHDSIMGFESLDMPGLRLYKPSIRLQALFKGVMNLPSLPIAAFDPEGLVFAVGMNSDCIKLYDVRTFDKVRIASSASCCNGVPSAGSICDL